MAKVFYQGVNGSYYEVVKATLGQSTYQWYVYDSAGGLVRSGYVTTGLGDAVKAAKAYIDNKDIGEIEYDDLKPVNPVVPAPVKPEDVVYPHTMYDCATGKGYQARNEIDHQLYASMGYVHDLSECQIPPNGDSKGDNGLLETAGIFVVGVAKGTLIAAVPITTMAVAVGFMRRIVRFGVGVSS